MSLGDCIGRSNSSAKFKQIPHRVATTQHGLEASTPVSLTTQIVKPRKNLLLLQNLVNAFDQSRCGSADDNVFCASTKELAHRSSPGLRRPQKNVRQRPFASEGLHDVSRCVDFIDQDLDNEQTRMLRVLRCQSPIRRRDPHFLLWHVVCTLPLAYPRIHLIKEARNHQITTNQRTHEGPTRMVGQCSPTFHGGACPKTFSAGRAFLQSDRQGRK